MRDRERILASLETAFREAFSLARERGDEREMSRLDLEYQRDQIHLEVLLDVRDLLAAEPADEGRGGATGLLEKAQALKNLTRLR